VKQENKKKKGNSGELRLGRWFEEHGFKVEYIRGSGSVKDRPGVDLLVRWTDGSGKDRTAAVEVKHGNRDYVRLGNRDRWWRKLNRNLKDGEEPVLAFLQNYWREWVFRVRSDHHPSDIRYWIEVPEIEMVTQLWFNRKL